MTEDLWSDEISSLVDAAFETVGRNPSDHETAVAYRRAISAALASARRPNYSEGDGPKAADLIEELMFADRRSVMANVRLGKWLSAALDDPDTCEEMKADIREWFSAGHPPHALTGQIRGNCDICQNTGEIVADWERYLNPHEGDRGDEAVIGCPFCDEEHE